jgi:WD40 repeat protein
VQIVDALTGKVRLPPSKDALKFESHTAFSPDGRLLAVGQSLIIQIRDSATGKDLRTLSGHKTPITSVAFSPDSSLLLSGDYQGVIKLWHVDTGSELATFRGHGGTTTSLAFAAEGRRFLSGSTDQTVRLWDIASSRQPSVWPENGVSFDQELTTVGHAVNGDATLFAEASSSMGYFDLNPLSPLAANVLLTAAARPFVLNLVDARTGHLHHNLLRCPLGTGTNPSFVSFVSVAFSGDGSRLAGCDCTPFVHVWETATGREIATYQGHDKAPFLLAISPDGLLAASSRDQEVRVWEANTGRGICVIQVPGPIIQLDFAANGRSILVFAEKTEPGEQQRPAAVFAYAAATGTEESRLFAPAETHPHWVAFSRDGKLLAMACVDNSVYLLERPTGRVRHVLRGHRAFVLAFSPDSRRLVSVGDGLDAKVWDTDCGQEILTISEADASQGLQFTSDGHRLVSSLPGGLLQVWDATPLELPPKP